MPTVPIISAGKEQLSLRLCLLILVGAIGILLLPAGDFGRSWDVASREAGAQTAQTYYLEGFDGPRFQAAYEQQKQNLYYGTFIDLLIGQAQRFANDEEQRWAIRSFIQAFISLSCLIPVFLISERIFSRPLALVVAVLVGITPSFFGHAFINPKDSVFASVFLWTLYLMFYCFDTGRRHHLVNCIGLGILLGVLVSLRFAAVYLLFIMVLIATILPALRPVDTRYAKVRPAVFPAHLPQQIVSRLKKLSLICAVFIVAYTALMPGILSDFRPQALGNAISMASNFPWSGTVLYFGHPVEAQNLPWHYFFGYLLVKLPLYYHLFLVTMLVAILLAPRAIVRTLSRVYRSNYEAFSVVCVMITALAIPLVGVLVARPVLYDGLRHLLFVVPLLCIVLSFGFLGVIMASGRRMRIFLAAVTAVCVIQSVVGMWRIHPYEYAYYNPLANPVGTFELDYWGTSFREVADGLNEHVRKNFASDETIRLAVNGPPSTLVPFLDVGRFEIVAFDADPDFVVVLNRWDWLVDLKDPWLFSVGRGDQIYAVVARP